MPRNTPTHPVSVISSTSRAVRTGPTSFWLVPVSTIPAVQVYIFRSVSPLGDTSSSHVAHITILASLGGPQSIENGPIRGKHSTLAETQVYIFGSVSPPGRHIILPHGTHHNREIHTFRSSSLTARGRTTTHDSRAREAPATG